MNWLKGSTSAEKSEKPFGQGRFQEEDPGEPAVAPGQRRPSNCSAERSAVPARRVSTAEKNGTAPAPTLLQAPTSPATSGAPVSPAASAGDDLRDWVASSMDRLAETVQEQLDSFRKQIDEMRVQHDEELRTVKAGLKLNSDLAKRAENAARGANENIREMREVVQANVFDHRAFSELKAQVQEAVQYLDDENQRRIGRLTVQSDRLQSVVKKAVGQAFKDYKDLDLRLTLQSLVASTFSLKAATMTEDARGKSLRYLEGEENRIKGIMSKSPRSRLTEEEMVEEFNREIPSKTRPQRPSLLGGPGELVPAEAQRQQTRGLVELLSAEIFCINAASHDDFTRKMCVEVLKRRAGELRSSTTTAAALEAIHAEALSASSSDSIPVELEKPLQVAATDRRISFTERL